MKSIEKSIFILFITLSLCSCKKDKDNNDQNNNNNNNNNTLPDAVFHATVSGYYNEVVDFVMPGQQSGGAYNATGSYVSAIDLMGVIAIGQGFNLGIYVHTGGVQEGSFSLNQDGMGDSGLYSNSNLGTAAFISTGGTLTISNADVYQTVGSIDTYFVDGSFTMNLEDSEVPPNQVTITGTFSGVNMSAN